MEALDSNLLSTVEELRVQKLLASDWDNCDFAVYRGRLESRLLIATILSHYE